MVVRSAFLENPCVWTVTVRVNRICRCVCVSAVPRLLAPARDGEKIVWRDALAKVGLGGVMWSRESGTVPSEL